jgi:hypothetical protein
MTERDSDYPAQIADFLEDLATKIRSMTVDRARNAVTWTALGILIAVIGILAVLWLLVAYFRVLGALVGQELAYAITGGILIIVGALLWIRRFPDDEAGSDQ